MRKISDPALTFKNGDFMKNFFRKAAGLLLAAVVTLTAAAVPVYADDAKIKLPSNEAMKFVDSMGAGWNLGNTFDAANCTWIADEMGYETGWQPDMTSKALIKAVKNAGFGTIRVPVSWHDHVDKDLNISEKWMDRVAEVIDWCLSEDLYVIINIHHDVEKGYYYPTSAEYKTSADFMKKIWQQICEKFGSCSDKLIFESINEPRLTGTNMEWWYDTNNVPDEAKDSLDCINKLNQLFVDTVRATGGNNKTRYLLVGGYDTDGTVKGLLSSLYKMPEDTVKNRLIADVHYYGIGERSSIQMLDDLYKWVTTNEIPIIISEYGLNSNGYKYDDNADIAAKRMSEFVSYARAHAMSVVLWDNNYGGTGKEGFKFFDRAVAKVANSKVVSAAAKVANPKVVSAVVKAGAPNGAVSVASSDKTVTSEPEKLTVKTASSASKIKLSWTAPEGATKYAVYQYKGGKYKLLTSKCTKTSYTVGKLKSGTTYKFAVRAYVNGKWSGYTYVKAKTK